MGGASSTGWTNDACATVFGGRLPANSCAVRSEEVRIGCPLLGTWISFVGPCGARVQPPATTITTKTKELVRRFIRLIVLPVYHAGQVGMTASDCHNLIVAASNPAEPLLLARSAGSITAAWLR